MSSRSFSLSKFNSSMVVGDWVGRMEGTLQHRLELCREFRILLSAELFTAVDCGVTETPMCT